VHDSYSHAGFDPIRCYEELRVNIFMDPLYTSRSRYLIENQGMSCWLKGVSMLSAQLSSERQVIDEDSLMNFPGMSSGEVMEDKLSVLLAEVILNICPEVTYV